MEVKTKLISNMALHHFLSFQPQSKGFVSK